MNAEAGFVFALLAAAGLAMASNRVRFDVVALCVLLALIVSDTLTVRQALAGFGSSVVIVVAGLLVIGEMLVRTGVVRLVGDLILKHGGSSETRLLILIMVGVAVLGSVMSSTAVVAVFIPVVLRIATETSNNASRMLMPMSYAALISGMLTLIATSPNIVVHQELMSSGFTGFGFFSFTLVGIGILVVAMAYMLLIGRRLLASEAPAAAKLRSVRRIDELWEEYRGERELRRVLIESGSPLVGDSTRGSGLSERYGVRIVSIAPDHKTDAELALADADQSLAAGDAMLAIGLPEDLDRLQVEQKLRFVPPSPRVRQRFLWDLGGAAVLIHPDSRLVGQSLREAEFRTNYGVKVLGMRRAGQAVRDFEDAKLQGGDSLFVFGPWSAIRQLQARTHNFVVLELPSEIEDIVPSYRKMPLALGIFASMVLLTVFDVVPLVAAVLIAVLAAVSARCLSMEDAYRSISWSSIVLIAGMMPLADALTATGGTEIVVDALMTFAGESSPRFLLTVLFFLTAALGLVLSNTASAVLAAPIAISAAGVLGVSPYPFAVAIVIAASCAYSTPVSTPVVTLIVDPGRYRFVDFVKVGVPLLLLSYLVTLILVPVVFPFHVA